MKFGVRLAVQGEMGAPGAGFDYARQMALEAEALGVEHPIIQPIPPLEGMRCFAAEILPAFA